MANITSKIVDGVISSLEKMKSPDKSNSSFWSYLKDQLYSESPWDQSDLAVIEKEIMKELSKLNQNDLTKIWKLSEVSETKLEGTDLTPELMKTNLVNEFLSKVLDKMDDNYSSGSAYTQVYTAPTSSSKRDNDTDDEFIEEEHLEENEFEEDFEDDDLLDEESFDDDEENP